MDGDKMDRTARPNDLESYWMPFTANRQFKAAPRLMASANGMYYRSIDGREILDGTAGLWCVNAGHARREIAEAVHRQVLTLDYAPAFQMGHPAVFEPHRASPRCCPEISTMSSSAIQAPRRSRRR